MERQCSCWFAACSLPFSCTRATAPDSARYGQGSEGYDTSRDTNFHVGDEALATAMESGSSLVVRQRRAWGRRRRTCASSGTLQFFIFSCPLISAWQDFFRVVRYSPSQRPTPLPSARADAALTPGIGRRWQDWRESR
jgi:hypothetical protein